ncbi:cucumber peeling cupredoxin-like [Benincasa hispida]|uniref:cucumber peeling cupredoxin-like n=1 Tax=Benincasa hispida TaxID=102211 RepID=UPI00190040A4|nr:cucumber peeling cupredoxin-like [Benincasa hispida]
MAGGVGFVLGFIAVVFVQHATATVHVVGDTVGWTVPPGNTFYSDWADENTFVVGDSLSFKFPTGAHDVLKVTKESFEACSSDKGIGNVLTTGPATVKLDTAGMHYFICTVGKHCSGGQKLSISVSAASGGAMSPSSLATPTPANSPSSSLPNESGSPTAPAPSSSTAVTATIYVTLSAIVMNLF